MVVSKKNGIFTLNFGEDEPILRSIFFQLGWFNHQPGNGRPFCVTSLGETPAFLIAYALVWAKLVCFKLEAWEQWMGW